MLIVAVCWAARSGAIVVSGTREGLFYTVEPYSCKQVFGLVSHLCRLTYVLSTFQRMCADACMFMSGCINYSATRCVLANVHVCNAARK